MFLKQKTMQSARAGEAGNVMFFIFIAILGLALLTAAVSRMNQQQGSDLTVIEVEQQIDTLLGQSALLAGAVQQMLESTGQPGAGISIPQNVAASITDIEPTDSNFNTAPHEFKVYHPYGGGVQFMAGTDPVNPVANNIHIRGEAVVTGVGLTDTDGDILFTAVVTSQDACQRINDRLHGTTAIPNAGADTDTVFGVLFTGGSASGNGSDLTDGVSCTSGCNNIARGCVSNSAATAFGYYQVLLPN